MSIAQIEAGPIGVVPKAATGQRAFFAPLEAFRGFAALLVAWFHSGFVYFEKPLLVRPANIYVDFFFVLSGFVLMHAYLGRVQSGMGFYRFAALRLARLWPLHMAMLFVWVVYIGTQVVLHKWAGIGDGEFGDTSLLSFVYNVLLIHSLGVMDHLTWNYPSWSISAEYYTYLIFFVFLSVFMRVKYTAITLASLAATLGLFFISILRDSPSILASHDFGLLRCIAGFFAGAAVYGLYQRYPLCLSRGLSSLVEIGALCLSIYCVVNSVADRGMQLASIASFVVLIFVFSSGRGILSDALSLSPFRFLGRISYSVYLVHAIVLSAGGFVMKQLFNLERTEIAPGHLAIATHLATPINLLLLGIVIVISTFTYRYIELPGQSVMKRMLLRDGK
ncbi:acyltransferase [Celeribacter arenosi]|uniref:Acyltransferase n=1 Tax=Celeribacter arenosi TaxID=792649 RepID=A0ABP7JRN7_9RHOB